MSMEDPLLYAANTEDHLWSELEFARRGNSFLSLGKITRKYSSVESFFAEHSQTEYNESRNFLKFDRFNFLRNLRIWNQYSLPSSASDIIVERLWKQK